MLIVLVLLTGLVLLVVAAWEMVFSFPLVGEELVDQTFRLAVGWWFPAEVRGDRVAGHEGALAAIGASIFKHDLGHSLLIRPYPRRLFVLVSYLDRHPVLVTCRPVRLVA